VQVNENKQKTRKPWSKQKHKSKQ